MLLLLTICLNACLAIDLIMIIRSPFAVKEKRVRLFLWGSIFISVALAAVATFTSEFNAQVKRFVPAVWAGSLIYIMIAAYLVVSIYSIVYACRKLNKPGISKESYKLVLKRHIILIVVFFFSQVYCFISLANLYIPKITVSDTSGAIKFFKLLFVSQGIYVPLIRLGEPFFFYTIWQNVKDFVNIYICCHKRENTDLQIDEKTLLERDFDAVITSVDDEEIRNSVLTYQQMRKDCYLDQGVAEDLIMTTEGHSVQDELEQE